MPIVSGELFDGSTGGSATVTGIISDGPGGLQVAFKWCGKGPRSQACAFSILGSRRCPRACINMRPFQQWPTLAARLLTR